MPSPSSENLHANIQKSDCTEVRDPIPQQSIRLLEGDDLGYYLRPRKRPAENSSRSNSKKQHNSQEPGIFHKGSFESAKRFAQNAQKWLLVNMEPFILTEWNFSRTLSQNDELQNLISQHFIVWQDYQHSRAGRKYIKLYQPVDFPYLGILDPATGENLEVCHNLGVAELYEFFTQFLSKHQRFTEKSSAEHQRSTEKSSEGHQRSTEESSAGHQRSTVESSAGHKRSTEESSAGHQRSTVESSAGHQRSSVGHQRTSAGHRRSTEESLAGHQRSTVESSADKPIASDLPSKMTQTGYVQEKCNVSDTREDIRDDTSDSMNLPKDSFYKVVKNKDLNAWKKFLGKDSDPKLDLVIRLPNGERRDISWPRTSKLKSLYWYVKEMGFDMKAYEIIAVRPYRCLTRQDLWRTLEKVLFPREVLFLQLKIDHSN